MADEIKELHDYTFLTNSDAHSLAKIAREYQMIEMGEPSFKEFYWALHNVNGRGIKVNYGMNPKLGKYYSTVCDKCLMTTKEDVTQCPQCGSEKIIKGVFDRIQELADANGETRERPPYIHQVPLEYLPKLGPKTFNNLLDHFGTEMAVIHHASLEELKKVVSEPLARMIVQMRTGNLNIKAGGGGKYGRIG